MALTGGRPSPSQPLPRTVWPGGHCATEESTAQETSKSQSVAPAPLTCVMTENPPRGPAGPWAPLAPLGPRAPRGPRTFFPRRRAWGANGLRDALAEPNLLTVSR